MGGFSEGGGVEGNGDSGHGSLRQRASSSENEDQGVWLRRTKSVAMVEQISQVARLARKQQADKPFHEPQDSLFSWSSGFNKYEGFINWGAFILVLGGTRLFLENILKYGIRVNPLLWVMYLYQDINRGSYINTPMVLIASNVHYLFVFYLEKLMSKDSLSTSTGLKIQVVHLILVVAEPYLLITFWPDAFGILGRILMCSLHTIMFLKLWSYSHVNQWCRIEYNRRKKQTRRRRSYSFAKFPYIESEDDPAKVQLVHYPDNLNLADLYYFLVAPTLCYELNFPRGTRIRKRRVVEVALLSNIILMIFQQWIIPTVRNSFKPFSDMEFMKCCERLLKLSIPNHLLWLTWFYMFFHSFLNTVGELLMFSDRNFYQDWWNAKDLGTFWRLWNLPVHKWAVRHIYLPMVKAKYNKWSATLVVFALSAFFHEYLVSVPLQMYKIIVFFGMLTQFPLVYLSSLIAETFGERWGNVIVWASLILGQPLGILVYYHDYVVKNFDPALLTV